MPFDRASRPVDPARRDEFTHMPLWKNVAAAAASAGRSCCLALLGLRKPSKEHSGRTESRLKFLKNKYVGIVYLCRNVLSYVGKHRLGNK